MACLIRSRASLGKKLRHSMLSFPYLKKMHLRAKDMTELVR